MTTPTPTQAVALHTLLKEASKCIQGFWKPDGELPPAKSYELVERIDAVLAATADIQAEPDTKEEDEFVINKLATILAEIAIAFKGEELPRHRHGYHDLAELAAAKMLEIDLLNMQAKEIRAQTVAACQREIEKVMGRIESCDLINQEWTTTKDYLSGMRKSINACLNVLEKP